MIISATAKYASWNHGDPLLPKKPFGKFYIGKPGTLHRGERIKCTFRNMAGKTNPVKAGNKHIPTEPVFVNHTSLFILCRAKCFKCSNLAHHRRAQHDVLVDLKCSVTDLFWRAKKTHPPPGHRIGFGESVECNRSFPEILYRRRSGVGGFISELRIYFIADEHQVLIGYNISNRRS